MAVGRSGRVTRVSRGDGRRRDERRWMKKRCTRLTSDTVQGPTGRTVVDGVDVLGSLSPSRASDFMSCPLLFRFRTVDHLPEPFSPDAVRGTVVHRVLENLFDLPAADRTPTHAAALLAPAW